LFISNLFLIYFSIAHDLFYNVLWIIFIVILRCFIMCFRLFLQLFLFHTLCICNVPIIHVKCSLDDSGCSSSIYMMLHDVFLIVHEAPMRYYSIAMWFFFIIFHNYVVSSFFIFPLYFCFLFLFWLFFILFHTIFSCILWFF